MIPGKWLEGLLPEMPLVSAIERMLDRHGAMLRAALPAVVEHGMEDVEGIHRLRVATRRLSAVLGLFRKQLGNRSVRFARKLLRRIRRDCSLARDLDVQRLFYESLLAEARDDQKPGLRYLIQQNVGGRFDVQERLRARVPKYRVQLERSLARFDESLRGASQATRDHHRSVHDAAAARLPRRLAAFWRIADEVDCRPKRLHELRIACKKLRYAFDVFAPVLTREFRESLYPQLQLLQETLGQIQDAAVGSKVAKDLGRNCARELGDPDRTGGSEESFAMGIAATRAAYRQVRDEARGRFLDFWPQFASADFRNRLEESCSALELEAIPP